MEHLTNLFQVHKTVKFELRPIGKTKDLINKKGFLKSDDKEMAMAYQVVKCLIDDYYQKEVIAPLLEKVKDNNEWSRLLVSYGDAIESSTRRTISKNLAGIIDQAKPNKPSSKSLYTPLYDYLQKQEIGDLQRILKDLQYDEISINNKTLKAAWNTNLKDFVQDAIDKFKNFTLYFDALAVNMKQVFSGKKNGIAHRIIYQNLYSFFRNKRALDDLRVVIAEFRDEKDIAVTDFSNYLLQDGIDKYNKYIGQLIQRLKEYEDSHPNSSRWHRRFKQLNKQILSPRIAPDWLPAAFTNDEMMVVAICAFMKSVNPLLSDLKEIINQIDTYNGPIFIYRKSLRSIAVQMTGDYKSLDDAFDIPKGYSQSESLSLPSEVKQEFFGFLKDNLSAKLLSIQQASCEADEFLNLKKAESNDYRRNNKASVSINKLMNTYKQLYQLLRPLTGTGEEEERDEEFYGSFMPIVDALQPINELFDSVRNWLTKKAYSNDSYPAYLGIATILDNWSKKAVYLKKDGKYYFCLSSINNGNRAISDENFRNAITQSCSNNSPKDAIIYITYKQPANQIRKNLPRFFICPGKDGMNSFVKKHPELLTEWEQLKGDRYKSPNMKNKAISYFQRCLQLHDNYKKYLFHFQPASRYDDYNSFVESLEHENLFFFEEKPICWNEILKLVEDGKIYLFQLYNKDYADNSPNNSKPNLHTLYWEAVFSQQNHKAYDFKLEEPKLYFREKADVVQRTGDIHSVPLRFQKPKMHLHIPILMNANATQTGDINQLVLEQIQAGTFTHIIGIDRGERNLLYYSVLDMNGNIVKQGSLNVINDVDYHKLLLEKEADLDDEQKKWKARSGIRKLKEGYLSHAIYQLTNLIRKYNAILVIEDLDEAFKRGRQKIDMQIYQLFEKMLIEKLSFWVDKNVSDGNHAGSTFRALQLATPGLKQEEKGIIKQNGILFFVPPEYTSAIDPVTGFCNLFDRERVKGFKGIKEMFAHFQRISYNVDKDWFEFEWDYQDVLQYTRLKECANPQPWVVCSMGERIEWTGSERYRNQKCESVDLTTEFKTLFERYNIQYENGVDLKDAIASIDKKEDINELKRLFFLTVSLRNKPDKDTDYILSPVRDANGAFFDSRLVNPEALPKLPVDGDANGAYNIGRKGLLSLNKLKNGINEPLSLEEWVQSVRLEICQTTNQT